MILFFCTAAVAESWPTFAHDERRTAKSSALGPSADETVRSVPLMEETAINMPPVIAEDGTVYVGTWGVVRSDDQADRTQWDKVDGSLFAFDADLLELWNHQPDLVPYCYAYEGRTDAGQCPDGGVWNYYNGTVEGTPVLVGDRIIFGRGDGKLYAVDSLGARAWTFATYNPVDIDDPEGGGEIITGILATPDGAVVFGTTAVGEYETNAFYAVDSETGAERWRFPRDEASLDVFAWAAPALSPDGTTVYLAGAWGPTAEFNAEARGKIWAVDVATGALKWEYEPINTGVWWEPWAWIQRLAVGSDGTIYVGGSMYTLDAGHSVVFALADDGDSAVETWDDWVEVDGGQAQFVLGLALDEVDGETWRVVATASNGYTIGQYPDGGAVIAIDATSGGVEWSFDPQAEGWNGGVMGVALDANGDVYATMSGTTDGGRVFSLDSDGLPRWDVEVGGLIEWGGPVIGPDGTVFVGETRRCPWLAWPIEDGYCDEVDINPALYAISGPSDELDAHRVDDVAVDEACGCADVPVPELALLLPFAALGVRRRR